MSCCVSGRSLLRFRQQIARRPLRLHLEAVDAAPHDAVEIAVCLRPRVYSVACVKLMARLGDLERRLNRRPDITHELELLAGICVGCSPRDMTANQGWPRWGRQRFGCWERQLRCACRTPRARPSALVRPTPIRRSNSATTQGFTGTRTTSHGRCVANVYRSSSPFRVEKRPALTRMNGATEVLK